MNNQDSVNKKQIVDMSIAEKKKKKSKRKVSPRKKVIPKKTETPDDRSGCIGFAVSFVIFLVILIIFITIL